MTFVTTDEVILNVEKEPVENHFKLEVWWVTPEVAERLLNGSHGVNRRVKRTGVAHLRKAMKESKWIFCADPLRLSEDGVIDGQHRLRAVIDSGTPQLFLVQLNAKREDMKSFDQNIRRTPGDHLLITGISSCDRVMTGMLHAAISYEAMPTRVWAANNIFNSDYTERYFRDPGDPDIFEKCRRWGLECYKAFPMMRATDYAFTCFQLIHFGVPLPKAREFISAIADPLGLPADHPIRAYHRWLSENRDRYVGERFSRQRIYNNNIKVYNAFKTGGVMKRFRPHYNLAPSPTPIA